VDFLLEGHGGVNIEAEDNTPMGEDDNVLEDMIEEDGIGAGDEETHNDGTSEFDSLQKLVLPIWQNNPKISLVGFTVQYNI
jgi:hypothetical protein